MRRFAAFFLVALGAAATANAHDIPNERVDRALQATLTPGRLRIDFEVSLAELTLAQDLRRLVGIIEAKDRRAYFDRYGEETAPLNARGLLVALDGRPLLLRVEGFDLAVEEHPRFTFHFDADLPTAGHLT